MRLPGWRRKQQQSDLEEEIARHLQFAAGDLVERGESAERAQQAARREFGNVALVEQVTRDQWPWRWLDELLQDLRHAARMLRKNPGFTVIAILTLALGIGANTSIFSVVHAVLLKALPYPQADRLVMVYEDVRLPNYQNKKNEPSPGNFSDWSSQNTLFESMAAYRNLSFNLTGEGEPARVEGELVTSAFFTTLQIHPALGRVFASEEDRAGNSHVVVVSDGLWKSRFASDVQILGKKILLDSEAYTIIGVMPPGFHFPDPEDQLWVPMGMSSAELSNRGSHFLLVLARLKPEITLTRAQAEMEALAKHLTEQYPATNTGQTVNIVSLHNDIAGPVRPALLVLMAAVSLVLLIACANVANLLLARASVRQREIALRRALGASRSRIARQLFTESVLLALLGCTFGLLLARWCLAAVKLFAATTLPRTEEFSLNGPVLLFSVVHSFLAGIVFGVGPALQAAHGSVHGTLKSGTRESPTGSRLRTRNLLVVVETALGAIVVIGAVLLLRSFLSIEHVPLGFQPQGILTFRVIPRGDRYSQLSQRAAFYQQVLERIEALPGVKSAAAVSFIPLTLARGRKGFAIEGRAPSAPGQIPMAGYNLVTPGYFGAMRIALLRGRDFSWSDSPQTQPVVTINEAMAKRYWPNQDPVGKRIRQGGPDDAESPWLTITGVVADVREFDPMTEPHPTIYFPIAQFADPRGILRDWVVRTDHDPKAIAANVRAAVWDVDKDLPVTRIRTMEEVRSTAVVSPRLNLLLFGFFAALALILASVGIYGVTAYSVSQRTREIGIRMALGASRNDVARIVVRQGVRLATIGVLLGLLGAFALTRLMTSMIYNLSSSDPATFALVAFLLMSVALAACYIPARRAMRVDPIVALRYE
jgi:putative ABC transport system permease protein